LKLADATLRSWVVGREYPVAAGTRRFPPLIHPASRQPPTLSFWNLIEAHVLRALRTEHGVKLKALRDAIRYAEGELHVERLLLNSELRSHAGEVFLTHYGDLISLSHSGQLAMRKVFEEHLRRVQWDKNDFPVRLYPFVRLEGVGDDMPIAIDAQIAFGRPVVKSKSISTAAIAGRIDAGESVAELETYYGISAREIEQAVLYERAA
jgi:uncharacterized protein (DUF433 family)